MARISSRMPRMPRMPCMPRTLRMLGMLGMPLVASAMPACLTIELRDPVPSLDGSVSPSDSEGPTVDSGGAGASDAPKAGSSITVRSARSQARLPVAAGVVAKVGPPAGVRANDFLFLTLAIVLGGTADPIFVTPTGWNIQGNAKSLGIGGCGNELHVWWLFRVATASEPADYDFTWTGGATGELWASIVAYTGVDTTRPFDGSTPIADLKNALLKAPSVTSTVDGALVINSFAHAAGASSFWTAPAGTLERTSAGVTAVFDFSPSALGPTGVKEAQNTVAACSAAAMTAALRPVGAP